MRERRGEGEKRRDPVCLLVPVPGRGAAIIRCGQLKMYGQGGSYGIGNGGGGFPYRWKQWESMRGATEEGRGGGQKRKRGDVSFLC